MKDIAGRSKTLARLQTVRGCEKQKKSRSPNPSSDLATTIKFLFFSLPSLLRLLPLRRGGSLPCGVAAPTGEPAAPASILLPHPFLAGRAYTKGDKVGEAGSGRRARKRWGSGALRAGHNKPISKKRHVSRVRYRHSRKKGLRVHH